MHLNPFMSLSWNFLEQQPCHQNAGAKAKVAKCWEAIGSQHESTNGWRDGPYDIVDGHVHAKHSTCKTDEQSTVIHVWHMMKASVRCGKYRQALNNQTFINTTSVKH